jgi:hypothetical protein
MWDSSFNALLTSDDTDGSAFTVDVNGPGGTTPLRLTSRLPSRPASC